MSHNWAVIRCHVFRKVEQVWSCRAWIVQPVNISGLLLLGSLESIP